MTRSTTGLAAVANTVVVSLALLLAGTVWADKPTTVPRTGGIPACEASLAEANGNLNQCTTDLGTCNSDLGACNDDLGTCEDDLAACEATQGGLPGDGQDDATFPLPPPSNHGAALAYTDNGDGTITDENTKLMWEQKAAGGTGSATCLTEPHGVSSLCTWAQAVLRRPI